MRGFLTSAAEGNTVYRYKRDSEGRVTEKSDSRGKLFEIRYNPDGTIDRLGGTRYYYNYAGQLTCVMPDGGTGANYEYDNNGALIRTECHNGLTTTYAYDSRGRLESLKAGFAGETALLDAKYAYNGNGNRTGKEEKLFMQNGKIPTGAVTQYAYDSMNRLTMESRNGSTTAYTYDMAGNRTSRLKGDDKEEYRYNSRNQLTELTGAGKQTSYKYDPAGNLTQEQRFIQERSETRKYTYDVYNRNTEVKGEGFTQKNYYDAGGYRCSLEENGKKVSFVYCGGTMLAEYDEENNLIRNHILGNEYLGYTETNEENSNFGCYIMDEQGSTRYILNKVGEVQNYYQYDAFGETTIFEETITNRICYNGQMKDGLTGLIYLRARYYDSEIGRFTQEDLIYNDGFNLYVYCDNNPVIYCDPSGLAKKDNNIVFTPIKDSNFDKKFPILGKTYNDIDVTGTVYSRGKVRTIDRKVYQLKDIDWDYISSSPLNKKGFSNRQLARLGKVPFGPDDMWIELHHLIQKEPGAMIELYGSKHDKYSKQLHNLIESGGSFRNNTDLGAQYEKFRSEYWKERIAEVEANEKNLNCKKKGC